MTAETELTGALAPVRKSVTVQVPVDQAFAIFADRPTEWWPAHHKLVAAERAKVVFEPFVDGRWFERALDGEERAWGRVVTWEAPKEIVLTWRINARWQPVDEDEKASEIAVFFTALDSSSTRVELEHRCLERHGADGAAIRAAIDGPSPGETLAGYAKTVADVTGRSATRH